MVLDAVSRLARPDEAIREAREELRRRLRAPVPGMADKERARLTTAIARLGDMFKWGHIDEAEYRRERSRAEALLVQLPDNDKLVMFDRPP